MPAGSTPRKAEEAELVRQILLAASAIRMPDGSPACVLFRQQVGNFVARSGYSVKVGIEGQADLGGFLRGGRAIQIEVKTPTGRLRDGQVRWAAMAERMGVLYLVARSVEDVTKAIREAVAA